MRSGFIAACLLFIAAASPAAAQSTVPGGDKFYFGFLGGVVIAPDMEIDGANSFLADATHNTGFAFGATFGYKFGFGPRVEAEFTYRRNTLSTLEVSNDGGLGNNLGFGDLSGTSVGVDGTLWSMTGMLNAWYDLHITRNWVPYAGAGAGFTHASIDPDSTGIVLVDGSDSAFAWQVGAGIAYLFGDFLTFSLDYRYLRTLEMEFQESFAATALNATYQTHSLMFTVRGAF